MESGNITRKLAQWTYGGLTVVNLVSSESVGIAESAYFTGRGDRIRTCDIYVPKEIKTLPADN
jgi:hypothetical protein